MYVRIKEDGYSHCQYNKITLFLEWVGHKMSTTEVNTKAKQDVTPFSQLFNQSTWANIKSWLNFIWDACKFLFITTVTFADQTKRYSALKTAR